MEAEGRTGRTTLAVITSVAAAVLGVLTVVGGLALTLALVSSHQPPNQIATAGALLVAGVGNVFASRGIYRERVRSALLGSIVTITLIVYLAAALRDFGELFWLHAGYLALLAVLYQRHLMAGDHRRLTNA